MRRILLSLIIAVIVLAPAAASAVDWLPIVPCGGSQQVACTPCDLFKTFKNVIDLVLYGITGPLAAFMIVWAGGLMLVSAGNPARFAQGTTLLKNTLYGVTIILLAWVFTNTLIKTLVKGNVYDAWNEFTCPDYLRQPAADPLPDPVPGRGSPERPRPELAAASEAVCDPANLASANKVPNNVRLNSPSLNALIACVNRDPIVSALYDRSQLFTFEVSNPLCNLTHGVKICGPKCQHSVFSCHYGGQTGNQGAMAVDYNWNGRRVTYIIATRQIVSSSSQVCKDDPSLCRSVSGEEGLFDELYRATVINGCSYKLINFEPGGKGTHTHISTMDCSGDGDTRGAIGTRRDPPILP